MKRVLALISCLLLAACAPQPGELEDTTWEVVAVYVDPATPSGVMPDAAGRALLAFGPSSLAVQTGCAPLQARAEVSSDFVRLVEVKEGPLIDVCQGGTRLLHTHLTSLLTEGSEFDIRSYGEDSPKELVMTKRTDAVDKPALRLVAQ
ncbi:hypothetical protein [Corynebacterium tuscaniense]|uniref:hypothetical protein n=1 Tax=Corynebacterium tuscaniense TaxID=302449 RepID=UPI00050E48C0|nr:hypothetical protein [Corynebacterium tuscaniense]KGF24587.1 hypothetical protein HMPREF2129_01750 [Corynebacterium tuscaniense DNF00037]